MTTTDRYWREWIAGNENGRIFYLGNHTCENCEQRKAELGESKFYQAGERWGALIGWHNAGHNRDNIKDCAECRLFVYDQLQHLEWLFASHGFTVELLNGMTANVAR